LTRGAEADGVAWTTHDLAALALPGQKLSIFPNPPTAGAGFYLCLARDHSQHVLAVALECELAGGAGVDPNNPPFEWQVWQGGLARWAPCELEYDGTGGFNRSGELILHTPTMAEGEFQGLRGYWLRCRLTDAQAGSGGYRVSPEVESVRVEARGGTVGARHATTVLNEIVGTSDGAPGQRFQLLHAPLLARDPARDQLVSEQNGSPPLAWSEVADFGDSGPEDRHFTLDSLDGTLTFGPALLQPDGTSYRFGAAPPKGALLRFARYQHGGGVLGNVPRGMLSVLKSSIPSIAHVANRQPAVGGRDAQSLDDAKLRAPQTLRTRWRAVTADDYEQLAREVNGVARARCIAPGAQPGNGASPRPGQVQVVVLPGGAHVEGYLPPEELNLSAELRAGVLTHLEERRLVGTTLDVIQPQFIFVSIQALVRVAEHSDPALLLETQQLAEAALYRYLNPYTGGPRGTGWPFGRDLHVSEIYGVLQRVAAIEFVEEARVGVVDPGSNAAPRPAPPRLELPPHGIICSGRHTVTVQ
jgi:predicted phage baseplate assembly protein